jgi:hypothetical protein
VRPSHHRALDLYLLNSGQPSANVHEAGRGPAPSASMRAQWPPSSG